ncbi:MAG: hypothetical protein IJ548_03180 [Paludibacteraceae bacterium]|nr:hypothetical protein [Paludibacteraceae bacterium]MBQ9672582.1 hypothetical protein [Prevotella sp.]
MKISEFFESPNGDIYSVSLSSEDGGLISNEIRKDIEKEGIIVLDVELNRIAGTNPTSTAILLKATEMLAKAFLSQPNIIICYYCDFLSLLPYVNKRRKNMTVQEYRHILFSHMFDRFVSHHNLENVNLAVLTVEGSVENYYIHVIARNEHINYISYINNSIQKDFGKP